MAAGGALATPASASPWPRGPGERRIRSFWEQRSQAPLRLSQARPHHQPASLVNPWLSARADVTAGIFPSP